MSVGFGVYYQEKQLGTIKVLFKSDSTWTWAGTGVKPYDWEDGLTVVFRAYPYYQGYKVFKHCRRSYYFPERDGEINEIIACGYPEGKVDTLIYDPIFFMTKKRQEAIDYLENLPPLMDSAPK